MWRRDLEQALQQASLTNKRIAEISSAVSSNVHASYASVEVLREIRVIAESCKSMTQRCEEMDIRDRRFTRRVTFLLILLAVLEVTVPMALFIAARK